MERVSTAAEQRASTAGQAISGRYSQGTQIPVPYRSPRFPPGFAGKGHWLDRVRYRDVIDLLVIAVLSSILIYLVLNS